jgi:uracil-DNA glycosylase
MLTCADAPKTLGSSSEREARRSHLSDDHIRPLTDLVDRIRADRKLGREVPYFDPCDGGIKAQALFLFEAPGPKAVHSGFVSRNNPDETAKNLFELQREAGLARERVALWNVVPWFVGNGGKIRPVSSEDLCQASGYLGPLVALLPHLRAVVLVGKKAQQARPFLEAALQVFTSPHPSPSSVNTSRSQRTAILESWREVALWLGG